jgi:hypothetical protein
MMYPSDMVALAEARRVALEKEIRMQYLLSQLPQRPARWRQWTGGSLMWAGSRLVNWGEGVATSGTQKFEIVG